jgi:hypothetical protein
MNASTVHSHQSAAGADSCRDAYNHGAYFWSYIVCAVLAVVLVGEAYGQVQCDAKTRTCTTPNLSLTWDPYDAEAIDSVTFTSCPSTPSTTNLTQIFPSSLSSDCNAADVEFFGNSYAPPDPEVGGVVLVGPGTSATSWSVGCMGTNITIKSIAKKANCASGTAGAAVYAGAPVLTDYTFWNNPNSSCTAGRWDRIKVSRTFTFSKPFTHDFRAYMPRLDLSSFSQVIYPTPGTTTPTTISASLCPYGCTGPTSEPNAAPLSPLWDATAGWFAISDPAGQGVIVSRLSSGTAQLWVDNDAGSSTNVSSVLLMAPPGGFTGRVQEEELLCFYDSNTWPASMQAIGQLPPGC